jgi:Fuc2NAc and GlcNAc transferase
MNSLTASVAVVLGAGAVSWAGTALVIRRVRARGMLDVPNERSSHSVPTPRGGGLAIASTVCAGIGVAYFAGRLDGFMALSLLCGGGAVAGVGWLDDLRNVPARWRAMVHTIAAVCVVLALRGLPTVSLGAIGASPVVVPLGVSGSLIGVLFLVWMINLFNFMDGTDGLAATFAALASLLGAVFILDNTPPLRTVALLVAGASAGFAMWNWAPARIFMGDVASGFLGFVIGAMVLASERIAAPGRSPAILWLVILMPFLADATITLTRRVRRGHRWYAAHRLHAYQRLVQSGWSHAQVARGFAVLTTFLGATAWWAAGRPAYVMPAFVVAVASTVACYLWVERRRPLE